MTQGSVSDMKAELELIQREARDELRRGALLDPAKRRARTTRRLLLERAIAAAAGQEYAEPISLDVALGDEWHLASGFMRETALICGDAGSRASVVVEFAHAIEHRFGGFDAGVFEEHPLYGKGLDVVGFHQIQNSAWLRELQTAMAGHPAHGERSWAVFRHYTVRGKRGEFTCIASGWALRVLHEPITRYRGRGLPSQVAGQLTLCE